MSNSAKLKAEEKFSAISKPVKRVTTERDLEQLARQKQTETLRGLRLAKEAADKEIADQQTADMSKTKSQSKRRS